MSLKAYDGMMTRKGFLYFQEKVKENIPRFKESSIKQLAKTYAEIFVRYADSNSSVQSQISFMTKTKKEEIEIKEVETKDVTILSYIFQCAKILSKSEFVNDFVVHLNLSLEMKVDKLLIYPSIFVPEHKKILLSFLEDWYAQNQCDPDENVPEHEWEDRCDDWNDFSETRGMSIKIIIFEPNHYWDNLVDFFRDKELINAILSEIPPDEERKKSIWKNNFINEKMKPFIPENAKTHDYTSAYFKAIDYYRTTEGQNEFKSFMIENPIELTKIDSYFISNEKIKTSIEK